MLPVVAGNAVHDLLAHFFEHYKDLEVGKWVKIVGWEGAESARKEIMDGIASYNRQHA